MNIDQQMTSPSIMNKLKSETHHLHEQVEQLAFLNKIMSGTLSLQEYYTLILHNYIFHLIVEGAIIKTLNESELRSFTFSERRKVGYLQADLLACETFQGTSQQLQLRAHQLMVESSVQFHIQNFFEGLGAMYVLEGATLGGNIIKRELSKIPEIIQHTAFHYYGCYGQQQGLMWKSFRKSVENLVNNLRAEEATINGATKTFKLLAAILKQDIKISS